MSDKLRTALKGGGRIIISVDRWANGDFHLCVTEDWARLTSIERATVSAEDVNAAEDPDGMIGAEIAELVAAAHISYEVKEKPPAPGADNTAQVVSAPFQNVVFRRNGMSFFTGQHTGDIQPYTPHHLPV